MCVCVCVCVCARACLCVRLCVCIWGGRRCVIIILICWLWLSGRLPTEETHLVNETSRSSGRQMGREEEKEEETERRKGEKVVTTREEEKWRKRKRYMEAGGATPVPKCLMKCWANEVLAVYAINSNSIPAPPFSPCPTLSHLAAPWQPIWLSSCGTSGAGQKSHFHPEAFKWLHRPYSLSSSVSLRI